MTRGAISTLPIADKALNKVLETLLSKQDICKGSDAFPYTTDRDFFLGFQELRRSHLRPLVAVSLTLDPKKDMQAPWLHMRPDIRAAFEACCTITPLALGEIIAAREKLLKSPGSAYVSSDDRCMRAARAWLIHNDLLSKFLHGAKDDLTNRLLGPLRMLTLLGDKAKTDRETLREIWREITDNFQQEVCRALDERRQDFGELGIEIVRAWQAVKAWIDDPSAHSLEACKIETLMGLLTECRVLAGAVTHASANTQSEELPGPIGYDSAEYRVLVVDDHAASWMPVFTKVADAKSLRNKIRFEFSINAQVVKTGSDTTRPIGDVLADYDAVLLDEFLPGARGTELLKEIRNCLHGLPVIMWTSSMARELPTAARMANGFLFKKTSTVEEIAETLAKWVEVGHARRQTSLLNPFFDHVIRTGSLRQCALSFTHWCLKYLDSFHALDSSYFKFFNDHGGRHIFSLLGILEKLIRPLLYGGSEVFGVSSGPAIFPGDLKEREKIVLCLYISVLCHEFGMFPMPKGEDGRGSSSDGFEFHTADELNLIRKQHALRSMLIVLDKNRQSPDFKKLMQELHTKVGDWARSVVAILVGHHSRFLELSEGSFCDGNSGKWDTPSAEPPYAAVRPITARKVQRALRKAKKILEQKKNGFLDNVRRLCALLRLADAIDVDYTRVPADFLLYHSARSARQDGENLKRLVVRNIAIDRGEIVMRFAIPLTNGGENISGVQSAGDGVDYSFLDLNDPFKDYGNVQAANGRKTDFDTLKNSCSKWLDDFFSLDLKTRRRRIKDAKLVAALAVIEEIWDEYKAIRDNGLCSHITLGKPEWPQSEEGDFSLLTKRCRSAFKISYQSAEGSISSWSNLNDEEEMALGRAFEALLADSRRSECFPSPLALEVRPIGGGMSGAKTCHVMPGPFQPRFCKIDRFERIDAEFKGLRQYAALHMNPRNLIGDVRIAKYRNYGVLLGSYLTGKDPKATPVTLEQHIADTLSSGAQEAIESLFREVLTFPCLGTSTLGKVWERLFKTIPDAIKKLASEVCKEKEMREAGEVLKEQWEKFAERYGSHEVAISFVHGDTQPRNVFVLPNVDGPERFILIDTIFSGYGHALTDLAMFVAHLNTHTIVPLMSTYNEKCLEQSIPQMCEAAKIAVEERYGKEMRDFETQYHLALAIRLFRALTSWSVHFPEDHRSILISRLNDLLQSTLAKLENS